MGEVRLARCGCRRVGIRQLLRLRHIPGCGYSVAPKHAHLTDSGARPHFGGDLRTVEPSIEWTPRINNHAARSQLQTTNRTSPLG